MTQVPGSALVRWIAGLVPWRRRRDWVSEWDAELAHAWAEELRQARTARERTRAALRLRGRALGAWRDALEVRRQYGGHFMLGTDVRYAVRTLVRRPRFAGAVVLTLSLGVGGAAAVYTVIDGLLLRPARFADVERVVELHTVIRGSAIPVLMSSGVEAWREQQSVFENVQAYGYAGSILAGVGEPERVTVSLVTPDLLRMLGAQPLLGRLPDAASGAADEVVIAEPLWRGKLGGRSDVLGTRVRLDDASYTVVGVLPASFRYPAGEPALWRPAQLGSDGMVQVHAVAVVQPGRSREQIEAEVMRLGERMTAEANGGGFPLTVELRWLADSQLRPEFQRALWVLAGAVLIVLLIACVNAANLLLVDTARREHELAIRGALGATRAGLVRQLVLESVVIGLVSAAAGLLMARWLVGVVLALAPQEITLRAFRTIDVDAGAVLFATALAVGAAVLYSLVPSLRAARSADLVHAPRATHGRGARATRGALVVSEVALSVVLVTGAGLLLNSFVRLSRADLGFQPRGLIEFALFPRVGGEQFLADLEQRLAALPQVAALARGDAAPSEASVTYLNYVLQPFGTPDDALQPQPGKLPVVHVDTAYLRVIGASLREGRNLLPEDAATGGVIIDSDLARHLWPNESAVGKRFRASTRPGTPWWHVVGVTGNLRLLGPDERDAPFLVMEHAPPTRRGAFFVIRAAGDPADAAAAVRSVVRALDPGLPMPEIRAIPDSMRRTYAERSFLMLLVGGFALVSTVLAIVGLYGVIAHAVAQRTREIGIRMALGARQADVLSDVIGGGAVLIGAGVVIGLAASMVATRLLGSMLFGVEPRDAPTFAAVALGVSAVALAAAFVPARRAARTDPVRALRFE